MPSNDTITLRKGTSSQWSSANPILASGEPGFDLTNNILKIGNGITPWDGLLSIVSQEITTSIIAGSGINLNYNSVNDILTISTTGVSYSSHTHTSSQITDFNSSVSGLLPSNLVTFTALDNQPPASNFAQIDTRNSIAVIAFDSATQEDSVFVGVLPDKTVVTSGLVVRLWWMGATATSGNVKWQVQFENEGTDNDSDSFDTATATTATANSTSGIETVTDITCTSIDSLTQNKRFRLKVTRVAADAADTMTGDAQLIAVQVRAV